IVVVFPFEHLPGYLGASAIFLSRILQGIAISIEYGAAITYVYETVPKNKTGFFTGVIQATAPLGFLSAMVVLFLTKQTFTEELYNNYFWRFPLFIGAILFFFSYKIRNELPESPAFSKVKSRLEVVANPLKEVFQKENLKKMIFAVFALCGVQGVTYYFSHSFIRILLESYFQASHSTSLFFLISIITLIWPIGLIVAHKSDSVGTRKLLTILLTLLLIFFPIFINIISGYNKADSIWIAFGPVAIIYALSIALYSITGKFLADLFPEQIRGTGISIPYHIGNGVFGGLITLIANIKTVNNENYDFVIGYILVTILISLMVNLFFFKNRA
ncbi:MAG: MFS transporter, partial [Bdellovibrionales bacterium]|nr:MFS transporter [Bdellovibrionales bacterium]